MTDNTTTDTSDDDQPFRFMDLPREMRDGVYDNLTKDGVPLDIEQRDEDGKLSADLIATVENAPLPACLRVSRRFGKEYLESLHRNQTNTLRLQDHNEWHPVVPKFLSPAPLQYMHKLELQLAAECSRLHDREDCGCWSDLEEHEKWITEFLHDTELPQLKECHVSICFNWLGASFEDLPQLQNKLKSFMKMSQITGIECYNSIDNLNPSGDMIFRHVWQGDEYEKTIFASWDRSQGWAEQVSEVEGTGDVAAGADT